jgi:WXG100 family type VII secretion target
MIEMTAGFGTTTEEMHRAAGHVFAVNDAVQAELSTLRARLAPLSAAWRGEAATAFAGLMNRWDVDAGQLSAALRGIGEAIQGSGAGYQNQEEQHASTLSAIRAALG